MARILFNSVVKRYGKDKHPVVKDFNLSVEDKEFIVFVGPSGCGKSTTLRMIAGLEEITEGDIFINEQRVNDLPPKDRDIAMVFQNYALYPNMTNYENIAFGLRLRKVPKSDIDLAVKRASRVLEIENFLQRKPRQLSGGQRQRIALGRAIVRKPQVFLMDEPLSNLDAKLRVQMRTEIIKLQRALGVTTIYVTHDQTEAMTMGDRIVVMNDGVIQQVDTPEVIYNLPANRFVASFVGSPPMNFIEGKLVERDGELYFENRRISLLLNKGQATAFLERYKEKPITLGIRPENLSIEPIMFEAYPKAIIRGVHRFNELMGADRFLYIDIGSENDLCVRVNPRYNYQPDEPIEFVVDMNKVLFFDPNSGVRIGASES